MGLGVPGVLAVPFLPSTISPLTTSRRYAQMADVKITVRKNGSLKIEGPIELYDADGNAFPLDPSKPAIALCRCGASKNAPFCDGSHKECEFTSEVKAPVA